ncbi:enoyl-CoA hydratase-related protein [Kribbella sp. NPDC051718]|uniref:enoyl-CoA hydratase/isomerase family protein n=1 Tax=Kribbella sp. NPDC051718 TaxID=3155168 RepID=UPI00342C74B9
MNKVLVADHPGGVRLLTMNDPDDGNALTDELVQRLRSEIDAAAADPAVRAVVLAGAGRAFCVGADLGELAASLDHEGGPEIYWRPRLEALAALIVGNVSAPIPLICALDGQAAGSGMALALSCDIRVASDRAVFNPAYGSLGSSTDAGLVWLLAQLTGRAVAAKLLLEQPIVRTPAALALGLVTDVVRADDLLQTSLRIAASVGSGAPHALRSAKKLLATATTMPLSEHIRIEHHEFLRGFGTDGMVRELRARGTSGA